jgi:hypothetical protein
MTTNRHPADERAARFAQHIRDLGRAFNVHIKVKRDLAPDDAGAGDMMCALTGRILGVGILIAPVIDETTYAVALHELGHCLSPLGRLRNAAGSRTWRTTGQLASLRDMRLQLEEERAAWAWARHYALEWTDLMTTIESFGLKTYRNQYRATLQALRERRRR